MIKLVKQLVKQGGSSVIGFGVMLLVKSIIKSNVRTPSGILSKVALGIGGLALSGYIARKVITDFEERVDVEFDKLEKANLEIVKEA